MNNKKSKKIPLVVTTSYRGVFFGYGEMTSDSVITLEQARMCIYWPTTNRGVLGLAADGPLFGSKVGPAVPLILLQGVTSIMIATSKAAEKWESAPWTK